MTDVMTKTTEPTAADLDRAAVALRERAAKLREADYQRRLALWKQWQAGAGERARQAEEARAERYARAVDDLVQALRADVGVTSHIDPVNILGPGDHLPDDSDSPTVLQVQTVAGGVGGNGEARIVVTVYARDAALAEWLGVHPKFARSGSGESAGHTYGPVVQTLERFGVDVRYVERWNRRRVAEKHTDPRTGDVDLVKAGWCTWEATCSIDVGPDEVKYPPEEIRGFKPRMKLFPWT